MTEENTKKPAWLKWAVIAAVIVIIAGIACAIYFTQKAPQKTQKTFGKTNEQIMKGRKYTLDKFNKVQLDMSYDKVEKILGKSTSVYPDDKNKNSSLFRTYTWKNNDGSNISIEIQNDKVISRTQSLLEHMDVDISLAKYNKISKGMSYKQVKAIAGDGQVMNQTKASTTYIWIKDNTNMCITFKNDKVDSKGNYKLK